MTRRARLVAVGVVVALTFGVGACGSGDESPETPATPSGQPTASASAEPVPEPTATQPAPGPTATTSTRRPEPAVTVKSANRTYGWAWPSPSNPGEVIHRYAVPPVPTLVGVDAAGHRTDLGYPPFDRVSFRFTRAFPSYQVQWISKGEFRGSGSGNPVDIAGRGVLRVTFGQFATATGQAPGGPAQAHNDQGATAPLRGSVAGRTLGRAVAYASAGDFEGVVVYGIGANWPAEHSNPQIRVRVYEVHKVVRGQHQYVVAVDIDAR